MAHRKRHRQKPNQAAEGEHEDHGPGDRLQKVLAAAGVGSRRDCEELIREGRVEVDRQVVTELGTRVDPVVHEIRVDGEALRQPKRLYFAVNKPVGVVTTNFDPSGRPRVIDLVNTEERVFAVGRLDRSSEGLILVTNDGEFANRITHPRYGVEKTYLARVAGTPGPAELARLRKGVYLSDGYCRVQSIVAKSRHKNSSDLVIVLNEGRNRELRRILARVGHKVLRLKRTAVGPIKLADLPIGAWRRLMPGEVEALLAVAKEKRKQAKAKKKSGRPGGMKPVQGERTESPYVQQQALMAEPLSLDDLLKDDLDDGGNVETRPAHDEIDTSAPQRQLGESTRRGGVIGGEDEVPRDKERGRKSFRPKVRQESQRSGNRRFGESKGRHGGRSRGKSGGKPFGRKDGRTGGGKFGKPGGKRKGRRG
jgi:23S rRNA pseudouridine2605 synthase